MITYNELHYLDLVNQSNKKIGYTQMAGVDMHLMHRCSKRLFKNLIIRPSVSIKVS